MEQVLLLSMLMSVLLLLLRLLLLLIQVRLPQLLLFNYAAVDVAAAAVYVCLRRRC